MNVTIERVELKKSTKRWDWVLNSTRYCCTIQASILGRSSYLLIHGFSSTAKGAVRDAFY